MLHVMVLQAGWRPGWHRRLRPRPKLPGSVPPPGPVVVVTLDPPRHTRCDSDPAGLPLPWPTIGMVPPLAAIKEEEEEEGGWVALTSAGVLLEQPSAVLAMISSRAFIPHLDVSVLLVLIEL